MINIIELAKEAGGTEMQPYDYGARSDRLIMRHDVLERFAALVRAEALEEAAKWLKESGLIGSNDCAAAIRGLK